MKNIQKNFLRALLVVLFITVGASRTMAYDHDDKGWFDEHHQHHPFSHHNGHQGYWDHDRNGVRIFVTI